MAVCPRCGLDYEPADGGPRRVHNGIHQQAMGVYCELCESWYPADSAHAAGEELRPIPDGATL